MNNSIIISNNSNNGLTLIEKQAINELPIGLQKFVKAKESEIISKLTPLNLDLYVFDFINELILNVGHTEKAKDGLSVQQISDSVAKYIIEKHPTLTKQELNLACLSYFIENDNDNVGVSLKSVAGAIRNYLNSELKKKAMSEWNKMIDMVQIRNYSEEQKHQIIVDGCIHAFEDFKNKSMSFPVDYLCAVFYDKLKELGLINFTTERKGQIYDEAIKIYKSGIDNLYENGGVKKDIYGSIISTISNKKTSQQNKSFVNLGKRIGLLMYFNDLLELDEDLKNVLNTKN